MPAHGCAPPPDRIGWWTCDVCGAGWKSNQRGPWTGQPNWIRSHIDNRHLAEAWAHERRAEALPRRAWFRRARLRDRAAMARRDAGAVW